MKVILIQCPSWCEFAPPYALALLSACLRQQGHEVYGFDLNIKLYNHVKSVERKEAWGTSGGSNSWFEHNYVLNLMDKHKGYIDSLIQQVLNIGAPVIGFSVQDTTRIFSEEFARRIKEKDRDKIIVFGGASCFKNSIYYMDFLRRPYVDALCLREGEFAFLDFLKEVESKGEISFCPGFAYRDKKENVRDCGEKELITDLGVLPFADFSDFQLEEYETRTLPISTSRGCIYSCAFCNEAPFWERYRSRSASNIFAEMSHQLIKNPSVENFFFNDSLINGNIDMLDELADLIIKNKLKIRWGG